MSLDGEKLKLSFNALVLAGGQSSRMGQDKALLKCHNGETLLQRASQLLKIAGANRVFISSHNPGLSDTLRDYFPGRGPVSGIHAALRVSKQFPLLVLPVDMPLMPPSLLQKLVHTGLVQQTSCCYVDQCLPLFIYDSNSAIEQATALLSDKQNVSVWRFMRCIDAIELATSELEISQQEISQHDCFKNANDAKQWQECLALMSLSE